MNNKSNRKHLTFEQRVEIEKALTENKSFAEIRRIIGKNSSTVSKEVRLHVRDICIIFAKFIPSAY